MRRLVAAFYGVDMTDHVSEVLLPHGLRDWPHSPVHRFDRPGTYIVTAATYQKQLYFASTARLTYLTEFASCLVRKIWMFLAGLGGVRESLSFCGGFFRARSLEEVDSAPACGYGSIHQSRGWCDWQKNLVSVLGYPTDLSPVFSGAAWVRSWECCAAWVGAGGGGIPLVLCWVVSEAGASGVLSDGDGVSDGSGECAG